MKTISVIQQKGGVGKTTLVLNLAMYFAGQAGLRVAVADADSQGSLTVIADLLDGVKLISMDEVFSLGRIANGDYDMLLIDTSPRNDVNLTKIITLSDICLLPVRPGYMDVAAMKDTEQIVSQGGLSLTESAIVLTQVQHRNAVNRDADAMLEAFRIPVLNTRITQRVAYQRSMHTNGVFGSTDTKAQEEIESLAIEIFNRL